MTTTPNLFFSCVDSRIQDQGSMYGRFHIGTFFRGQALTLANALRRTLLSEIPGLIIQDVVIDGASHEFATFPGIEENVLDILLNIKKLVFAPSTRKLTDLNSFHATGILKTRGPRKINGGDIKVPATVKCINPNIHIATLTGGEEFSLRFNLSISNPNQFTRKETLIIPQTNSRKLSVDSVAMPVQKVNYIIKSLNAKQGSEYLVLEVWTDGSILPQEAVQFALKNLTHLFYQFASLSK